MASNRLFEELSIVLKLHADSPGMTVSADGPDQLRIHCPPRGELDVTPVDTEDVVALLRWHHPEDVDRPHKIRAQRVGSKINVSWNGVEGPSPAGVDALADWLLESLRNQSAPRE